VTLASIAFATHLDAIYRTTPLAVPR
jgi:hypothetical protein